MAENYDLFERCTIAIEKIADNLKEIEEHLKFFVEEEKRNKYGC